MNPQRFSQTLGAFCFVAICTLPKLALACAGISDAAYSSETFVEAERAVIIWDQAHHTEHFIRQASIRTQSPDLGFLVPTPQTPEIAEVDSRIFDLAADVGRPISTPPIYYHTWREFLGPVAAGFLYNSDQRLYGPASSNLSHAAATARIVEVIEPAIISEQDVAGYHATVLSAEDYPSITAWLSQHGYTATPELTAWLKTYGAAKWKITAFALLKDSAAAKSDGNLTTRAIRLSFASDRPFYPYSEPSDRQKAAAASPLGRALRVAVLSDQRVTGDLADRTTWPGRLLYAGSSNPGIPATATLASSNLTVPLPASVGALGTSSDWLKFARLDDTAHSMKLPSELTTFLDESNPRPGTADLYFSPNSDPSPFRGTETDYQLPTEYRMTSVSWLAALIAFFVAILTPCAPIYCGWRIYTLHRARKLGLAWANGIPSQKIRVLDRFMGASAIVLGTFYGFELFAVLPYLAELQALGPAGIFTTNVRDLVITGALNAFGAILCWGTIFCGVNLWRRAAGAFAVRRWSLFASDSGWRAFMGGCSLCAGGFGVFLMLGLLFAIV